MKTINTIQSNDLCTLTHNIGCGLHKHCNCEFIFFLTGTAQNTIDSTCIDANAGDVFFISHRSTHSIQETSHPYQHRDVYISNERLKQICEDYYDTDFYEYLTKPNSVLKIPIDISQFKNVSTYLQELETLYTLYPHKEKQDVIKSCILSIIVQLLGIAYGHLHFNTEDPHSINWLLNFITHIQKPEIFTKPVQDIIASSNYSHSHFCTLFRKRYNKTFKSYINELRINYAISLLQTPNISGHGRSDRSHQSGSDNWPPPAYNASFPDTGQPKPRPRHRLYYFSP